MHTAAITTASPLSSSCRCRRSCWARRPRARAPPPSPRASPGLRRARDRRRHRHPRPSDAPVQRGQERRTFTVALGIRGVGKQRQGDNRTPLGRYGLARRARRKTSTLHPRRVPDARAGAPGIHGQRDRNPRAAARLQTLRRAGVAGDAGLDGRLHRRRHRRGDRAGRRLGAQARGEGGAPCGVGRAAWRPSLAARVAALHACGRTRGGARGAGAVRRVLDDVSARRADLGARYAAARGARARAAIRDEARRFIVETLVSPDVPGVDGDAVGRRPQAPRRCPTSPACTSRAATS